MKTAKVIEFPYSRIRREPEAHEAKILPLPRPGYPMADLMNLPMAVTLAWLSAFGF